MSPSPEKELENLLQVLLAESPWKNKVFSVGGFVRDDVLGIPSKDLDIVIEEDNGAEHLSRFIKDRFPDAVSTPYKIGAAYPIWHLGFFQNILWKGRKYQTSGAEVDIADTQKAAPARSELACVHGMLSEDIARRDFTVNMLLRDLTSGNLLDLTGVSLSDIQKGILRTHPGIQISTVFQDDPLRMIRLIRFRLKYGWNIDPRLEKGVAESSSLIQKVAPERIRDELIKIMEYGKLSQAIQWMDQVDLLNRTLPEIHAMKGVEQDLHHHSEGDVYVHTLLLLEKANPGVIPQLSALLHDVGKPKTQSFHPSLVPNEPQRIKFLDHENIGAEMSNEILRRLKFDVSTIERINKIIRFHLRPHFSKDWSAKAVRKFVRECGEELPDILHLSEIDSQSSHGPDGSPKENIIPALRERIAKYTQLPIRKTSVLTGNEIMELLNLAPGKSVGLALTLLQDIEDDYAVQGLALDKENAKQLLKVKYVEVLDQKK